LEEAKAHIYDENKLSASALAGDQQKQLGLELRPKSSVDDGSDQGIKDVWLGNFFTEIEKIGLLVDKYPYIAMVSLGFFLTLLI